MLLLFLLLLLLLPLLRRLRERQLGLLLVRLEDAQAILRLRSAEGHHRVLWVQYAL